MGNRRFHLFGGYCGAIGTIYYILAISIPLPEQLTYLMAILWPVLSIIFVLSIYDYLQSYKTKPVHQLALVFACIAFSFVALMISIQLAVRFGIDSEIKGDLLPALRLVDLGVDVAWDVFIGLALIFLSVSIIRAPGFGKFWGIPAMILGVALIILNIFTFPWPPDTRGLVDIGPLVGFFIILLSIRLIAISRTQVDTSKNG